MGKLHFKFLKRRLNPEFILWKKRNYAPPATNSIKRSVLIRHAQPNGDWIETGTYLGETAEFIAKSFSDRQIHSIEPSYELFTYSFKRLAHLRNLVLHHGSSETILEPILKANSKVSNFWLDGHHSGDVTFLGVDASPIVVELQLIKVLGFSKRPISVFIDDFRLFGHETGYPTKEFLVDWASHQNLDWGVEADIFYCKSRIK